MLPKIDALNARRRDVTQDLRVDLSALRSPAGPGSLASDAYSTPSPIRHQGQRAGLRASSAPSIRSYCSLAE